MLRLREIDKAFGANVAVTRASLDVERGEIVAVVGENGAGKTTLMRIAAGELAPDRGRVERPARVAMVHQHFRLVDQFTIAENLALTSGRAPRLFTRRTLERDATEVITRSGIALRDVSRRVSTLSVGEKSKLALIGAVMTRPDVLILDEPTSVLTPAEADELFEVVRRFAAEGTAIVFISHKIPEVLRVAGRIIVMRAGAVAGEYHARTTSAAELARAMVPIEEPRDARTPREHPGGIVALTHGNLVVHQGEIVAIAGVAGNGQSELAATLRALHPQAGHIPEDRSRDGIVATMSVAENLALRGRSWNRRAAERKAAQLIDLYNVRASGPAQAAGELSGGNQQKVLLARELDRRPQLIVAAEPTRGLDVESAAFIHRHLRAAASSGAAIVLITSDLDEAFALADTLHVINRGTLSDRLTPEEARTNVARLMAGMT